MRRFLALAALALAGCVVDTSGAKCDDDSNCPPGEGCGYDGHCSTAAACPAYGSNAGDRCDPVTAVNVCNVQVARRCDVSGFNPDCNIWTERDCALETLDCDSATVKCICRAPGATRFADALHGSPKSADPAPNGARDPGYCRFKSIADALDVAAGSDAVTATGRSAGTMVFSETGSLNLAANVSLGTDDAPPDFTHYAIAAGGSGAAFLTMGRGSQIAGIDIRNAGFTGGDAIATACPGPTDTATVTIKSVKIGGVGPSGQRFTSGLHHTGNCSLDLSSSTVSDASDTGIVVDTVAATSTLRMVDNTVQKNQALTMYTISAIDRLAGGLVIKVSAPASVVFQQNRFLSNTGDQVLVFVASGSSVDLSAPSTACMDGTSNILACYTSPGVAISTRGAQVNVAHTTWSVDIPVLGTDYVGGAAVIGATQSCSKYALPCP